MNEIEFITRVRIHYEGKELTNYVGPDGRQLSPRNHSDFPGSCRKGQFNGFMASSVRFFIATAPISSTEAVEAAARARKEGRPAGWERQLIKSGSQGASCSK